MTGEPFQLTLPQRRTTSVVFASPHSGRDYPEGFLRRSVLNKREIRSSEDAFVDELFAAAPRFGAPLLAATFPRAYVDLNRSSDELDPALIERVTKGAINPRVASGLGVIPRVVANGRAIYRGKLPRAEAEERLKKVWQPYHRRLAELLGESHAMFGEAILIDCHSMPHEAIEAISRGRAGPDIVLGDRFGASADGRITDRIEAAFAGAGLKVVRNAPFAGAFTTQHYGRPSRNQHVVQVEIDRSLYMDESRLRPNGGFADLQKLLSGVIAEIASIGRKRQPLAAE